MASGTNQQVSRTYSTRFPRIPYHMNSSVTKAPREACLGCNVPMQRAKNSKSALTDMKSCLFALNSLLNN